MLSLKENYFALFGDNIFECLQIILWGWLRNRKLTVILPGIPSKIKNTLKHLFFIRKYLKDSVKEHKTGLGNYKGLWYKVNEETIDLTLEFYDQKIRDKNPLVVYYIKIFNTNKFEVFVKKKFSNQIFALLKDLHIIRLSNLRQKKILINKNPLNEFVVKYTQNKYKTKYQIKWISSRWHSIFLLVYYGWLIKQIIYRGITINKKLKKYKISKEAAWNFYPRTLRDDIFIDHDRFKINDILMLEFFPELPYRIKAFKEAKKRGFETADVTKLKININKNIFDILLFYLVIPFLAYCRLVTNRVSYFYHYIFLFHRECLPIEILMNLYDIDYNFSVIDHDDVAKTIILNKYNSKNIIVQWSDLTFFKAHSHAFIAHNIYFFWGNIHSDYHADNNFIDNNVNVGCIYKSEFRKAISSKNTIIEQINTARRKSKIVTFFDSSFSNSIHLTEEFFLEFLDIIKDFSKRNQDVFILLKPKSEKDYENRISAENLTKYRKVWDDLIKCEKFKYLNPLKWNIEKVIAISDVCISMGMHSPSTISLICGKNALYFDNTGNSSHPFANKYKNLIVFDEREQLFKQINNILHKRFKCQDAMTEREIRDYDAFSDDNAFERIKNYLIQS